MPPQYRLSRTDFTRMRGFKRLHGSLFSLSYGRMPERLTPGSACVVSAKTAPRAVDRNRIKRRCRSVLLLIMPKVETSFVLVWHAKKEVHTASSAQMRTEITMLVRKAGALLSSQVE